VPPSTVETIHLRQAFESLARDDFLAEAVKTMRFQPRFEVGQSGVFFQAKCRPLKLSIFRQYIEQLTGNRLCELHTNPSYGSRQPRNSGVHKIDRAVALGQ
jgi:hypothetical protein